MGPGIQDARFFGYGFYVLYSGDEIIAGTSAVLAASPDLGATRLSFYIGYYLLFWVQEVTIPKP
eukprot:613671-Alexandrium_andersonii.AAC.1